MKRLARGQVENYRRDGFVSPVRMLSLGEAASARRERESYATLSTRR